MMMTCISLNQESSAYQGRNWLSLLPFAVHHYPQKIPHLLSHLYRPIFSGHFKMMESKYIHHSIYIHTYIQSFGVASISQYYVFQFLSMLWHLSVLQSFTLLTSTPRYGHILPFVHLSVEKLDCFQFLAIKNTVLLGAQ